MAWYFIGVYIINRTLYGRLEIWNFSSHVENISLVCCAHSWNIFQHSKRNFVSPHNHVISSISLLAFRCCYCHHLNPARKQRPTAPKLDYDTWTPPRQVSGVGAGAGVRHRKPTNSVQAMLEKNGENVTHNTIQYNSISLLMCPKLHKSRYRCPKLPTWSLHSLGSPKCLLLWLWISKCLTNVGARYFAARPLIVDIIFT